LARLASSPSTRCLGRLPTEPRARTTPYELPQAALAPAFSIVSPTARIDGKKPPWPPGEPCRPRQKIRRCPVSSSSISCFLSCARFLPTLPPRSGAPHAGEPSDFAFVYVLVVFNLGLVFAGRVCCPSAPSSSTPSGRWSNLSSSTHRLVISTSASPSRRRRTLPQSAARRRAILVSFPDRQPPKWSPRAPLFDLV